MELVHRVIAYAGVAAVGIGVVWSLALVARSRTGGRLFERYQLLVVGLFLVACVAGVVLLVSGGRPKEDLHLLYAAVAVGLIPLARSYVPDAGRRRVIAILLAFLALGGIVLRLFGTG
ncbi:MAG: hypothetical protein ACXWWQ_03070 [Candidatus Limnocylindria bacterium]